MYFGIILSFPTLLLVLHHIPFNNASSTGRIGSVSVSGTVAWNSSIAHLLHTTRWRWSLPSGASRVPSAEAYHNASSSWDGRSSSPSLGESSARPVNTSPTKSNVLSVTTSSHWLPGSRAVPSASSNPFHPITTPPAFLYPVLGSNGSYIATALPGTAALPIGLGPPITLVPFHMNNNGHDEETTVTWTSTTFVDHKDSRETSTSSAKSNDCPNPFPIKIFPFGGGWKADCHHNNACLLGCGGGPPMPIMWPGSAPPGSEQPNPAQKGDSNEDARTKVNSLANSSPAASSPLSSPFSSSSYFSSSSLCSKSCSYTETIYDTEEPAYSSIAQADIEKAARDAEAVSTANDEICCHDSAYYWGLAGLGGPFSANVSVSGSISFSNIGETADTVVPGSSPLSTSSIASNSSRGVTGPVFISSSPTESDVTVNKVLSAVTTSAKSSSALSFAPFEPPILATPVPSAPAPIPSSKAPSFAIIIYRRDLDSPGYLGHRNPISAAMVFAITPGQQINSDDRNFEPIYRQFYKCYIPECQTSADYPVNIGEFKVWDQTGCKYSGTRDHTGWLECNKLAKQCEKPSDAVQSHGFAKDVPIVYCEW